MVGRCIARGVEMAVVFVFLNFGAVDMLAISRGPWERIGQKWERKWVFFLVKLRAENDSCFVYVMIGPMSMSCSSVPCTWSPNPALLYQSCQRKRAASRLTCWARISSSARLRLIGPRTHFCFLDLIGVIGFESVKFGNLSWIGCIFWIEFVEIAVFWGDFGQGIRSFYLWAVLGMVMSTEFLCANQKEVLRIIFQI